MVFTSDLQQHHSRTPSAPPQPQASRVLMLFFLLHVLMEPSRHLLQQRADGDDALERSDVRAQRLADYRRDRLVLYPAGGRGDLRGGPVIMGQRTHSIPPSFSWHP